MSNFGNNLEILLQEEEARKEKSWELFSAREERFKHISAILKNKNQDDQSLWLNEILKLLAWIPRKKGRKRVRSLSHSRSLSKKPRCQDQVPQLESLSTPGTSKTGDSEEDGSELVVIIEEKEDFQAEVIDDDDFETPGIIQPKQVCRKKIDMKRKNSLGI